MLVPQLFISTIELLISISDISNYDVDLSSNETNLRSEHLLPWPLVSKRMQKIGHISCGVDLAPTRSQLRDCICVNTCNDLC